MTHQLTVYDENGTHVGMTFPKRARQLVSKQRAVWHDDTHTAIKLLPEAKEEAPLGEYHDNDEIDEIPMSKASDDLLLYLAKRHVREKKNLTRHFIAFIIACIVVPLFYVAIIESTPHPQAWRMIETNRQINTLRSNTRNIDLWRVDALERSVQAIFDNLVHPIMYVIVGVMVAWGVWVFVRYVSWAGKNKRGRNRKSKPDPVQVEFQRLKGLGVEKF